MNEGSIVSIIALMACLVLAFASYRSHRMNASQTIRMALIWGCIFVGVAFVFSIMG